MSSALYPASPAKKQQIVAPTTTTKSTRKPTTKSTTNLDRYYENRRLEEFGSEAANILQQKIGARL
jgi:hypothetical protein